MAIGDVYEVTVVSQVNGQRVVNVQHFGEAVECTDDIPARSICAMWEDVFLPLYLAALSNEGSVQCIYARRIDPTLGIPFLVVETSSPGLVAAESVPSNAAAVISFYTSLYSRSGRGRQYFSGVPESHVADGVMDTPYVGDLQDYADLFLEPQDAPTPYSGSWVGLVWSPTLGTGHIILAAVVSPSMGSMRSRRQPYGMIP